MRLCVRAASTHDTHVFSFLPNSQPSQGLDQVLWRYRSIVPHVKLSGPTSFAPLIHQAIRDTAASGMQYHILLLLADGQVTARRALASVTIHALRCI